MKYILFIALLLPSFLWAQENVKNKNSIQIIKGIGIGYHFLTKGPQCELTGSNIRPIDYPNYVESSSVGLNYRFGIDYQRQIIEGLSLKIGSRFSMWRIDDVSIGIECYTGWGWGYDLRPMKVDNYYVEMPFALQYKFGKKKLQFYVEVGANPMFRILHNNNEIEPFSFAIQVGSGLSYQISNNCSIFGQLSSRIQTNETGIYTNYGHLYEVGLELGVGFDF